MHQSSSSILSSAGFCGGGVFRNPSYTSSHSHVDGKCTSVSDPKAFSLFSLDGVFFPRKSSFLELNSSEIEMCTEIKCPYFRKSPHLFVPQRYVPQLQSGLSVTNCDKILFVSFTDDITTVFLCPCLYLLFLFKLHSRKRQQHSSCFLSG